MHVDRCWHPKWIQNATSKRDEKNIKQTTQKQKHNKKKENGERKVVLFSKPL